MSPKSMQPVFPDLRGKHVLITGSSNGIGAALCQAFAGQGCALTMLDRDTQNGERVLARCNTDAMSAVLYPVELTNLPALTETLAHVRAQRPVVDVLIVNAGYDPRYDGLNMTDQEWTDLFQLNVAHYFVTCRELIPTMQQAGRGASIIMTTSHTVWLAKPQLIAYNSTKAAIVGLTRSLAEAYGTDHIRVNAVAPGWTMTERQLAQWITPAAKQQTIFHEQAMPVEITPEELVGSYLFLASDSSRPLTRQILVADAGQSKH
ncbi:MAG: SDR family oxidoreductase [Cyanothece sp. SIO1E1]|nr:SDR family oxidoreductase [Cyanothece sp. SIO1E1]